MTATRWQRLKSLFTRAHSLPAGERDAFLREQCADSPSLLAKVGKMVESDERPTDFLKPVAPQLEPIFHEGDMAAGRFRIVRLLGRGGMGEVYEAEDALLHERVALKVVLPEIASDPAVLARFHQEIQLARRVTHPNVCRVYDLEVHGEPGSRTAFLTMELLEGETLAARLARTGPLTAEQALPLARQMAAGLQAAHYCGIVHRDFKSGNVMLVPGRDGGPRAVITDFGLARVTRLDATERALTAKGMLVGTLDYMAPEQVETGESSFRSDIYSLGLVLFEMVTGVLPFRGATPLEAAIRRMRSEAPSVRSFCPQLSRSWESTITRCLEREPARRFENPADVVRALELAPAFWPLGGKRRVVGWATAVALLAGLLLGILAWIQHRGPFGRSQRIDSLAILPLKNSTGDPSADYLTDGITEDLINNISKVSGMKVISRSGSFRYKSKNVDAQEAGRRLGVAAVVTGAVSTQQHDLVLSLELLDVRSNRHIWGQRYRRSLVNLASVHQDIAKDLAHELGINRVHHGPEKATDNPEAYQAYIKGRYYWNKRTAEGFKQAIEYFRQAIDKDPTYALAYSGLADCYMLMDAPAKETFPKAKAAAQKALEIDDSLAVPHASLGYIHLLYDWDWPEAQRELLRALELDPNYLTAHSMYARYLAIVGRVDEAIQESRRAVALDPLSQGVSAGLGLHYYFARRYDLATQQFQKTIDLDPHFQVAHQLLGLAYVQSGRFQEAIRELQQPDTGPDDDDTISDLAYAYARSGRRPEAIRELKRLAGHQPAYFQTYTPAALGEVDRAFELLEQAYREHDSNLVYLRVQPELDPLRSDPRFTALLNRLKL